MSLWLLGMLLKVLTYVLSSQKYHLRSTNQRIHLCRIGFQHEYQIFSDGELSRSEDQHVQFIFLNTLPDLANFASENMWTVSGE